MKPGWEELTFAVQVESRTVPALAWIPAASRPGPVVLLGHGGGSTKSSTRIQRLAHRFAASGVAAVAIDGPFHGERVQQPLPATAYQQLMIERGVGSVIDTMTADWVAVLDLAGEKGLVDLRRVGYLGMSMGSRFGIPLAAHLADRLQCAVFGKFGLTQSAALPTKLSTPKLISEAARNIRPPVLFQVQRGDELFPIAGALELFDAFASPEKTLLTRPGRHSERHGDDESGWHAFVIDHI